MFSVLTLLESYTGDKVDDFMSDPAIVEHYKVYLEFQMMTQEAAPSSSAVAKTAHVILSEEGEEEEAGATERSVASGTPQQQSSNASIDGVAHVTKDTWHRNDNIDTWHRNDNTVQIWRRRNCGCAPHQPKRHVMVSCGIVTVWRRGKIRVSQTTVVRSSMIQIVNISAEFYGTMSRGSA
jgi:hypothetical protein